MTKANNSGTRVYTDKISEYTREELEMLGNYIKNAYQNVPKIRRPQGELIGALRWLPDAINAGYRLDENFFSVRQWEALNAPLEKMPTYINDDDVRVAGIARWRLFLGR